jgi:hypothetical protein
MRQGVGFAMMAAVAVTALHFAPVPTESSTRQSGLPPVARPPISAPPTGNSPYVGGCRALTARAKGKVKDPPDGDDGAVNALIDSFFGIQPDVESATKLPFDTKLQYVVALVPDPRHTNLSMMFDRSMVMIQQAAQDAGYIYNSSWLPWRNEEVSYPLIADREMAAARTSDREACPGILLFRKSVQDVSVGETGLPRPADPPNAYQEGLVVLVVGEQPTGGLNENQWSNALLWLSRNSSVPKASTSNKSSDAPPHSLRILGPSYSGSLSALERHLSDIYSDKTGRQSSSEVRMIRAKFPSAMVLSGSVSSCASIRWFQQRLVDSGASRLVDFGSFSENDDLTIYRFMKYMRSQGSRGNDVAILSEDETAYASPPAPRPLGEKDPAGKCEFSYSDDDKPVQLSYPRDISALRSAYEAQSIFASPPSAMNHASHTILQESAEEGTETAEARSDTIRSYSRHITPIVQEAILYGIVGHLRVHHSRYLVLRCTNPLDFLFLTRFFHRAYPEAQIVTVGSDLLFGREVDSTEFRGVIALSNYPLLPTNQHWTALYQASPQNSNSHTHRIFESYLEGTYLAGRYLFDTKQTSRAVWMGSSIALPLIPFIPDFADPFWLHSPQETLDPVHAPTWLAVLGRQGYWPLAVLADEQPCGCTMPAPPSTMISLIPPASTHYNIRQKNIGQNRVEFNRLLLLHLSFSWKVCALTALLLLVYQAMAIHFGPNYASMGLLASFRITRSPFQPILLGVNSALALMLFLELVSVFLAVPDLTRLSPRNWIPWMFFAACSTLILTLLLFRHSGLKTVSVFLTSVAGMTLVSWTTYTTSLNTSNDVPIFFRMSHLTAGVSPMVPVLLLFVGFYLWTWQAMAGDALLSAGCPALPPLEDSPKRIRWSNKVQMLASRLLMGKENDVMATSVASGKLTEENFRISSAMGERIINIASPLCVDPLVTFLPFCLLVVAFFLFWRDIPLLSLESRAFTTCINIALLVAFLVTTAEACRLYFTWKRLARLLIELNRLRLRRTFSRLRAIDSSSLWSVSGNVGRVQYLFFTQQLDAGRRLSAFLKDRHAGIRNAVYSGDIFIKNNASRLDMGTQWNEPIYASLTIREVFNEAAADILTSILLPAWKSEGNSLCLENSPARPDAEEHHITDMSLSRKKIVRAAEEFVCFHYIAFIQNILARMRTIVLSMIYLFVSVCLAVSFYPFVPRTEIGVWMIANLALIGGVVVYVYAGQERDATLSYITNTKTGELGGEFWLKTASFLAAPVLGVLTTQFPEIANSILGWLQPGLDAVTK